MVEFPVLFRGSENAIQICIPVQSCIICAVDKSIQVHQHFVRIKPGKPRCVHQDVGPVTTQQIQRHFLRDAFLHIESRRCGNIVERIVVKLHPAGRIGVKIVPDDMSSDIYILLESADENDLLPGIGILLCADSPKQFQFHSGIVVFF